ncbi:MAG: hypothetical protein K8S87_02155 [Planctomycetes bacterium]|nr:hypothetical protein [Planctomycetota bacterium]
MRPFQYFIGMLLFVIIAIASVIKQVQVYEIGYKQSEIEQEIIDHKEEIRILKKKIAEKTKLEYLKVKAEEFGLQLIPPEEAAKIANSND